MKLLHAWLLGLAAVLHMAVRAYAQPWKPDASSEFCENVSSGGCNQVCPDPTYRHMLEDGPCPTSSPTKAPSPKPTKSPTKNPTQPTPQPTRKPTYRLPTCCIGVRASTNFACCKPWCLMDECSQEGTISNKRCVDDDSTEVQKCICKELPNHLEWVKEHSVLTEYGLVQRTRCSTYKDKVDGRTNNCATQGCNPFGTVKEGCNDYGYCKCLPGFTGLRCELCNANAVETSCGDYSRTRSCETGGPCVCLPGVTGDACEQAEFLGDSAADFCSTLFDKPCPSGQSRDSDGSCMLPSNSKYPNYICPPGWKLADSGKCLGLLEDRNMTASVAEEACLRKGATLFSYPEVSFTDRSVGKDIQAIEAFEDIDDIDEEVWLGIKWPLVLKWNLSDANWLAGKTFEDYEVSENAAMMNGVSFALAKLLINDDTPVIDTQGRFTCPYLKKDSTWTAASCDRQNVATLCEMNPLPIGCDQGYSLNEQTGLCVKSESAVPQCGEGWETFDGNCVTLIEKTEVSYNDAVYECHSRGAELASLTNVETQALRLANKLNIQGEKNAWMWIPDVTKRLFGDGQRFTKNLGVTIKPGILKEDGLHATVTRLSFPLCMRKPWVCSLGFQLRDDNKCIAQDSTWGKGYVETVSCATASLLSDNSARRSEAIKLLDVTLTNLEKELEGDEFQNTDTVKRVAHVAAIGLQKYFSSDFAVSSEDPFNTDGLWSESDTFIAATSHHLASAMAQFGQGAYLSLKASPLTGDFESFRAANDPAFKNCIRAPAPCGQRRVADSNDFEAVHSALEELELYVAYARCALVDEDKRTSHLSLVPVDAFISRALYCLSGLDPQDDAPTESHIITALNQVQEITETLAESRPLLALRSKKLTTFATKLQQSYSQPDGGILRVRPYDLELQLDTLEAIGSSYKDKAIFMRFGEVKSDVETQLSGIEKRLADEFDIAMFELGENLSGGLIDLSDKLTEDFIGVQNQFISEIATERERIQIEILASQGRIETAVRQIADSVNKANDSRIDSDVIFMDEMSPTLYKMIDLESNFTESQDIAIARRENLNQMEKLRKTVFACIGAVVGTGSLMAKHVEKKEKSSRGTNTTTVLSEAAKSGRRGLERDKHLLRHLRTEDSCLVSNQIPTTTLPDGAEVWTGSLANLDLAANLKFVEMFSLDTARRETMLDDAELASSESEVANSGHNLQDLLKDYTSYTAASVSSAAAPNDVPNIGDFTAGQCRTTPRLYTCSHNESDSSTILVSCCEYAKFHGREQFFTCNAFDDNPLCDSVDTSGFQAQTSDIFEGWVPALSAKQHVEATCSNGQAPSRAVLVSTFVDISCCSLGDSDCDVTYWRQALIAPLIKTESGLSATLRPVVTNKVSKHSSCGRPTRSARSASIGQNGSSTTGGFRMLGEESQRRELFIAKAAGFLFDALFLGSVLKGLVKDATSSPEMVERYTFPDELTTEKVNDSIAQLRATLDQALLAFTDLLIRFNAVFEGTALESVSQPNAGEQPVLWDTIYHQIMDMLEYDLDLCPKLVDLDDSGRLRRRLRERRSDHSANAFPKTSMRRSLKSKSQLRDEIAEAEGEMQQLKEEYFQERENLYRYCGHFRGAIREFTMMAKNAHMSFFQLFEEVRTQMSLELQLATVDERYERSQTAILQTVSNGGEFRTRMLNIAPIEPLRNYDFQSAQLDIVRSLAETSFQEDIFELRFSAENELNTLCAAAMYADPQLKQDLEDICVVGIETSNPDSSLSLTLFDLGERMIKLSNSVAKNVIDNRIADGTSEVKYELLDITEMIDLQVLQNTGSATFSLAGPYGGNNPKEGGLSAAVERGGPFFCSVSEKLDNLEMTSVGILLLDKDRKVLGSSSSSASVRVNIKLNGPFRKTRSGKNHTYDLSPYDNIAFSYSLPNEAGECYSEKYLLVRGQKICPGSVMSQPDPAVRSLPSPYAQWEIEVNAGIEYLPEVYEVNILADIQGVSVLGKTHEYDCRKATTGYRIDGSAILETSSPTTSTLVEGEEDEENNVVVLAGVASGVVAFMLVIVGVTRRRKLPRHHGSVVAQVAEAVEATPQRSWSQLSEATKTKISKYYLEKAGSPEETMDQHV